MPIMPSLPIFSTVSLGKYSSASTFFARGLTSFSVGSNEFYLAYAATHPGVYDLLDLGHFHPTENVADKLSA